MVNERILTFNTLGGREATVHALYEEKLNEVRSRVEELLAEHPGYGFKLLAGTREVKGFETVGNLETSQLSLLSEAIPMKVPLPKPSAYLEALQQADGDPETNSLTGTSHGVLMQPFPLVPKAMRLDRTGFNQCPGRKKKRHSKHGRGIGGD